MKTDPYNDRLDPYAWTLRELYEQYAFSLLQFAYAMLKNREQSEEVVNDVFLTIWKKEDDLKKVRRIYPYLCQAVKNRALDYLAASRKKKEWSSLDLEENHIAFAMNPEHILLNKELGGRLTQAIQDLPPRCRMILRLAKEDGLKAREVAALLNISVRTVEAQLAIALKKIGESLLPYMPEQKMLQRDKFSKPD
jgi:RNA polymerase sigma-70 factor (ECF subfamily)